MGSDIVNESSQFLQTFSVEFLCELVENEIMNRMLSENTNPIPVVDEVEEIDNLTIGDTNDNKSEQGTPDGED